MGPFCSSQGVTGSPNPTKHPPLLVFLDGYSSVAEMRPCTSTHFTSLHLCENVLLRAPTCVTCPHMYAPLDLYETPWLSSSPPMDVFFNTFFFLFTLETQRKKNKDPPSYHLLGVVLQKKKRKKNDKMF